MGLLWKQMNSIYMPRQTTSNHQFIQRNQISLLCTSSSRLLLLLLLLLLLFELSKQHFSFVLAQSEIIRRSEIVYGEKREKINVHIYLAIQYGIQTCVLWTYTFCLPVFRRFQFRPIAPYHCILSFVVGHGAKHGWLSEHEWMNVHACGMYIGTAMYVHMSPSCCTSRCCCGCADCLVVQFVYTSNCLSPSSALAERW